MTMSGGVRQEALAGVAKVLIIGLSAPIRRTATGVRLTFPVPRWQSEALCVTPRLSGMLPRVVRATTKSRRDPRLRL
jgi:hypothetical protein